MNKHKADEHEAVVRARQPLAIAIKMLRRGDYSGAVQALDDTRTHCWSAERAAARFRVEAAMDGREVVSK